VERYKKGEHSKVPESVGGMSPLLPLLPPPHHSGRVKPIAPLARLALGGETTQRVAPTELRPKTSFMAFLHVVGGRVRTGPPGGALLVCGHGILNDGLY